MDEHVSEERCLAFDDLKLPLEFAGGVINGWQDGCENYHNQIWRPQIEKEKNFMRKIFEGHLAIADSMGSDAERLPYLTSVLRALLQASLVSIIEIARRATPSDEIGLFEVVSRIRKPSDGLPLQIIDELVPAIRGYVSGQFLMGWFEKTGENVEPLSKQLIQWVEFRNKRTAHGVVDNAANIEWSRRTRSLILECLGVFSHVLPIEREGGLYIQSSGQELVITTPLLKDGQAVVITEVFARKGIWKLRAQKLSMAGADEFVDDLPDDNIFSERGLKQASEYDLAEIVSNNKNYSFFHNVPVRQTDMFEGRTDEIDLLVGWLNDEDSRYCLVYGDGGYGKTTLVLEVLNQLLESQFDIREPIPTIVSFHTAKMTRWTEKGLVHLSGVYPVMDECVRELMRCFYPFLPKEWYEASGRQLIDKAVGILKQNKISRDDVLLIIDNTETLAKTPEQVRDLGAFFKMVGKLIGRVIITSRRREFIEATPIVIEGLSDEEASRLMRRLAADCNAKPILQAGEAKLRKVSAQLMNKPVLIEALVKYVARSGLGIDAAIENVFKKSNEELLEFLYEDAWQRMGDLQRQVFFVLINLSCPLEQSAISRACQEIGIQNTEFQNALEETHFSVMTDYGRSYTIEIVDLAGRFFLQQFAKLNSDERERLKDIALRVDQYSSKRQEVEREYRADRVAEAFRSEYAKAAKVYVDKGDVDQAVAMYELAVEDDPLNSALHDRFSWFLLNRANQFERAKKISEKAVELDGNNCDAVVGLALVCYRLGDIGEGDSYIDIAKGKGRSSDFCLLRKAIARYFRSRDEDNMDAAALLLGQAKAMLEDAEKLNSRSGGYDAKNFRDIKKFQDLVRRQLNILRAKRLKLSIMNGQS